MNAFSLGVVLWLGAEASYFFFINSPFNAFINLIANVLYDIFI